MNLTLRTLSHPYNSSLLSIDTTPKFCKIKETYLTKNENDFLSFHEWFDVGNRLPEQNIDVFERPAQIGVDISEIRSHFTAEIEQ